MKKIGIMTFPYTTNCGAMLQAYALKMALTKVRDNKFEIVIMNYQNDFMRKYYRLISIRSVESLIASMAMLPQNVIKKHRYKKFAVEHLFGADNYKPIKSAKMLFETLDLVIVGSDQIWNYKITGGDKSFFLDFILDKSKKYSYAASFGYEDNFDASKDEFLELLSGFDGVSLREPIGYEEISKQARCVHIHIDPTLLLTADEWLKISPKNREDEKYILVYNVLVPTIEQMRKIKELSERSKMKILVLPTGIRGWLSNVRGRRVPIFSPHDFPSLIANAEYIFTTSFHGVAFSIIFRRKFLTELNCKENYNYRVEHLLKTLGLEDRAIENFGGDFDATIDWEAVEEKLNTERQKSLEYLCGATDI